MRASLAAAAIIASLAEPRAAAAQKREVDLDLIPMTATIGYAWQHAPGSYWGFFAGVGWDEFGKTLTPDRNSPDFHDFEQVIFIGGMHRWRQARWDIDAGVRVGLGGVRETSDLPAPYYGVYASALWGGCHVKIGPRILFARVHDYRNTDAAVQFNLLTGRIILGR